VTKQDYELIARVLREKRELTNHGHTMLDEIAYDLSDALEANNLINFNPEKFFKACGVDYAEEI